MKTKTLTKTTALALALLAPPAVRAQLPPDASRQIDEVFAPWASTEVPGCAVGVAVDGRTVLERAYGMADLEWGVPNTPQTVFEGGSVSKQFTAAAVVLLALDGKLSLDDDVRRWVPEVPDYGETITLRHLLNHTSGLRDWGSVAGISGWGREERAHDHDDVLDIVGRQKSLNFEPGAQYSYSNTGYNLLAIVVARVSAMPFARFSEERIFGPLGLEHTQWRDDHRRIVQGRATAYDVGSGGRVEINRPVEYVHGNGGILTTVGDLLRWNQSLTDATLGRRFVEMMETPGLLNDGRAIHYALGLRVEDQVGTPAIYHTGSTAGYRAYTGRFPEHAMAVAMLCNASNVPTAGNGGRIARASMRSAPSAPAPTGVSLPAASLERLVGLYREPLTGATVELTVANGALRSNGSSLVARSTTEFQAGATGPRYVFADGGGRRPLLRIERWEHVEQVWEPVDPWRPTSTELQELAGTYTSEEAETTFVARVEDGELVLWQRPSNVRRLAPIYRDGFTSGGDTFRFRRDASGRVTQLSLSMDRVFDMRFDRAR